MDGETEDEKGPRGREGSGSCRIVGTRRETICFSMTASILIRRPIRQPGRVDSSWRSFFSRTALRKKRTRHEDLENAADDAEGTLHWPRRSGFDAWPSVHPPTQKGPSISASAEAEAQDEESGSGRPLTCGPRPILLFSHKGLLPYPSPHHPRGRIAFLARTATLSLLRLSSIANGRTSTESSFSSSAASWRAGCCCPVQPDEMEEFCCD